MATTTGVAAPLQRPALRQRLGRDDLMMRGGVVLLGLGFLAFMILPLYFMLSRSVENRDGEFIGLSNYITYFSTPALSISATNSVVVAGLTMIICITLAFTYAYALTRTRMPLKGLFRALALVPILAPSLLPAISEVYLFGNQGMAKEVLMGHSIYGPIGIVIGLVFWTFPHAMMILVTALSASDQRLYEAAESLGASKLKTFFTVTLPGAKYGVVSAIFVVFTLAITDFGVPKVIGGQYDVLATEVYKQVVGRQDFQMGAVVGVVLLIPAVVAFIVDRIVQRKQVSLISARAVPYSPKRNRLRDTALFVYCTVVSLAFITILGVAGYASFITFWPYNLELSWANYQFDLMDGGGWDSYYNSIRMAAWTAVVGTAVVFTGAYVVEKTREFTRVRALVQLLCIMPMAVPGLVLGLAYIFFFNDPANPLGFLYRTMAILVISTVVHYYTVSHLTAVTALKQMDPEFEAVSLSLKVPIYKTFWRVTVPVCLPAALDIAIYLFLNAMTTVSVVVFLYGPNTTLASVAVLNMDDAGDVAPAAAMGMMIVYTSLAVKVVQVLLTHGLQKRTQAWRGT